MEIFDKKAAANFNSRKLLSYLSDDKLKMDISDVINFCEEKKYLYKKIGENPRLILLGESHGCEEFLNAQEELIKIVKAETVVHELYRDEKDQENTCKDCTDIKLNPILVELNTIRQWAKKYEFKLEQGDTSSNSAAKLIINLDRLLSQINEWPEEISVGYWNQLMQADHFSDEMIYSHYFSRMISEPIMGYILQQKMKETTGPVIGIYGAYHLLPTSHIHHVLRKTFPPLHGPETALPAQPDAFGIQDYLVIFQYTEDIQKFKQFLNF